MEKKPYIGQLDRQVRIVRMEKTASGTGQPVTTDVLVCEPFAKLDTDAGGEALEGKELHNVRRAYVMRHRAELEASGKDFLLIDGDVRYAIEHVSPIGRRKFLKLFVTLYE